MATQVQFRRGNTVQHSTFAGLVGEITVDTDKDVAVIHDGSTAGGFPLAKYSDLLSVANTKVDTITSNSNSRLWANSVTSSGVETVFLDLSTSGVTAASYGGATQIPSITVDQYGRITSASNVTVQGMDYAFANTKLANTSGITFNGDLNVSGNLSAEGTTFFVNGITNRIGISRTDPGYALDVVGTVNATALLVNGAALSGGATLTNETASTSTYYPVFTTATSGSMTAANTSNTKLYFVPSTGTLSATVFNSLSDITLKTDIEEINGKKLLNTIKPISFVWKDTGTKSYGVIAQELEKELPELVQTNEQGLKSVSYIPMIAMLIDTVKKQEKRIEKLEQLLSNQK